MTREQYERGYVRLRQRSPGHPLLGVIISRGYTPIACEYLEIALSEPPRTEEAKAQDLFHLKTHLYSQRAVLSNRFHGCKTDAQRADISQQIGAIQVEIIAVLQAIESYKLTGKVTQPRSKENHIPADGTARKKKLHSVRECLRRFQRLLRTAKDPEKIKHYESETKRLTELARELAA